MTPLTPVDSFFLKREDLNPTGSAKDRAISLQVKHAQSSGFDTAVISSSGNAAISAAWHCHQAGLKLHVFVSDHISQSKLSAIKSLQPTKLIKTPRPISQSFVFAKQKHAYNLRQSTDPLALVGYQQIGQEIISQLPLATSIFIPVGSGTTLLGISQSLPSNIKIIGVQPACYSSLASAYSFPIAQETTTLTDSLSVKFHPLKNQIHQAVTRHQGTIITASVDQNIAANQILLGHQLSLAPEVGLALAAMLRLRQLSPNLVEDYPVIISTGRQR